jgi:hypothetical protein
MAETHSTDHVEASDDGGEHGRSVNAGVMPTLANATPAGALGEEHQQDIAGDMTGQNEGRWTGALSTDFPDVFAASSHNQSLRGTAISVAQTATKATDLV